MLGHSESETDWDHRAVFEADDTSGFRKAVGVCRRVEGEEEGKHWIDWTEDMDWGKRAIVADVSVSVSASASAGNDLHYWSGRRMWSVAHSCFLGIPWQ